MANINLIIEKRPADIGNFMVGRMLPFRQKRMVGPFIYLDHMGPVKLGPSENLDVLPHPHIGLSTLTYLLEGSLMHRDSIGSVQEIQPGAVNWMTAGQGVVHSERTPEYLRNMQKTFHGLQIWVALPTNFEQVEPGFTHIPASEIPAWEENGVKLKLIAGEAFGKKSPVPVYSRMFLTEIATGQDAQLDVGSRLYGESAMYILSGGVICNGVRYGSGKLLVSESSDWGNLELESDTIAYMLGGEPLPDERHIYWNFVGSDKEAIEKAKRAWKEQKFPKIPGETAFVPLPGK